MCSSLRICSSWLLSRRAALSRLSSRPARSKRTVCAGADGGVAERGGQEGLADPDRAHDHGVGGVGDEPQGEQFVQDGLVVADGAVCVEVVQPHGRVQAGGAGAARRGGGVAAGDLVGQDQLQELGVGQVAGAGQGEPLGQGGQQLAELDPRSSDRSSGVMTGAGGLIAGRLPGARAAAR